MLTELPIYSASKDGYNSYLFFWVINLSQYFALKQAPVEAQMQQISATPTSKGCFFLPSEADEVSSVLESCSDTPSHNPPFKYFHSYNILSHSYEKNFDYCISLRPLFQSKECEFMFQLVFIIICWKWPIYFDTLFRDQQLWTLN